MIKNLLKFKIHDYAYVYSMIQMAVNDLFNKDFEGFEMKMQFAMLHLTGESSL